MRLELIRHGTTTLQDEHRYQGITDAPLNQAGRTALHPADYTPDRVIVTPLIRTQETASILFPQVPQTISTARFLQARMFCWMDWAISLQANCTARMEEE